MCTRFFSRSISQKSYAKINIGLSVTGKTKDGLHTLDTIMVPIQLHDAVFVEKLSSTKDHYIHVDDYSLEIHKNNLVRKALDALYEKTNFKEKLQISIHKAIPSKAGLGGGSSDCGNTLVAINKLLKLNVSDSDLIEIAKKLGSDVPFFINPHPCRCQGTGDIITPIEIKKDYYVILVKPKDGCETATIYDIYDQLPHQTYNIDDVCKALKEGDDTLLAKSMGNSLQPAAISHVNEIQTIIDALTSKGLTLVGMSGSGSTVFGLSEDKKLLYSIADELELKYFVEVTKILK